MMGSTSHPGKLDSAFLKQLEQAQAKNTPPTASKPPTTTAKPAKSPATKPSVVSGNPVATGFKLPSIGDATATTLTKRPSAVTATGPKPTGLKPVTALKPPEGNGNDSSPATHGPVFPRKPSEVARKPSNNFNNSKSGCDEQSSPAGTNKSAPNNATSAPDTEAAAAPPWQSLVRKPKQPVAASESAATNNKTSSEESEDRSTKVKSLKLAFEAATPTLPSPTAPGPSSIVRTKSSSVNVNNPAAADQPPHPVQPPAAGPVAPSVSTLTQPKPTANKMQTVTSPDKKYRKRPMPAAPSTAPPRKPAKPPRVDLSVYFADAFDEVYDDATTLKSRESVVSQIEEYTEEEELRERQKLDIAPAAGNIGDDEIYDDVGGANADEMDEIYEEI